MIRQAVSFGMRHALRAPRAVSATTRAGGLKSASPSNNILAAAFSTSPPPGNKGKDAVEEETEGERLEMPTNMERIDASQQAMFHLDAVQNRDVQYQPDQAPSQGGMEGLGGPSYDRRLSLHSAMQSNVPQPFAAAGKAPSHLNMPGAHETQNNKYVAQQVQQLHSMSQSKK